jgi:hypothetical protein
MRPNIYVFLSDALSNNSLYIVQICLYQSKHIDTYEYTFLMFFVLFFMFFIQQYFIRDIRNQSTHRGDSGQDTYRL